MGTPSVHTPEIEGSVGDRGGQSGRMTTSWGSLLALAAEQHRVIALRQVQPLGVDPKHFRQRGRRDEWIEHGGTLWSPPGTTLDDWGLAMRAALWGGATCAVTGSAALRLHGLDVPFPAPVRVVVPMQEHVPRTLDAEAVRVIASRTLHPSDLTVRRRVPVTKVSRAFLDLALPPTPAVTPVRDAMVTALQRRLVDETQLRARFDAARGMPGRRVLLQALDDLTHTGADSPFSHRVAVRLLRDGFRPDRTPATVDTPGRTLHPDITFCEQRVCVECDGLRWHCTQEDLAVDHRKDRAYHRAGWTCLRLGWWEFDHGWNGFLAELRDALARPSR